MANNAVMAYIPRNSFVHNLTGTTKLVAFLLFSLAGMFTYDTRVLVAMLAFSLFSFSQSKIKISEVKVLLYFMVAFLILNNVFIYIFAPEQGVAIYGTRTVIFEIIGRYTITQEQLFYTLNITLKYFVALPMAIIFISTTNPSEFAASLNKIGVSYRAGYAVSLSLRYIPDIQREYREISQAQQARGVELGKKEPISKRVKNVVAILFPLVLASLQKIETISNAMELRGFGKNKKRTWYTLRKFKKADYIIMAISVLILVASLVVTYWDGNRFYNPFV